MNTENSFKYEDLYYATKIMRMFAAGELTGNFVAVDPGYFMAIADKLHAACELQGVCERAEGRW